ncbi:MAG TPA: 5'-3' exonuclease [Kineosporiaceae bacterium]|nr:5'-3' exonuclease [Kineosporiaceae bacterium]
MTESSRLMLLDSASLYFRAFHGVPETITAPDGTPVNAIRGFLDMISALVTLRGPQRLVACWDDDWRPAFRVAAIASYKAHRLANPRTNTEQTPPALDAQIPVMIEVLAAFGIARVGFAGLEADDVIGTLASREAAARPSADVDVVTGDRDLFQLVDDKAGIRVLYVGRGVRNLETVDVARLADKYGVSSGQGYADLAVLRGDPSDGLPGVAGIGEKTGASLLTRYGDLPGLLDAVRDGDAALSPGVAKKLSAAADYLAVAPTVVHVVRDAAIPPVADALPRTPVDPEALVALAARWGIESSLSRLVQALSATTPA